MPQSAARAPGVAPLRSLLRVVVLAALALAALSLLAPSAPTYDPWAWIIWGREVLHLDLVTTNGPSWKPLPVLLTTVFAVFGQAAPALWLVAARAGALAAIALAYLAGRSLGAGRWGAGIGAVTLATAQVWTVHAWLGDSEGLLVACLLAGLLAHLYGHPRAAFAAGVAAALLRPEAWPFLGAFALWLLWRRRASLRLLVVGLAPLPLLWFAPEYWGSGNLLRASARARTDLPPGSPGRAAHPGNALLDEFTRIVPDGVWVALAIGIAATLIAARRRGAGPHAPLAVLAAATTAWVAVVALMAGAGYSGNERYLIAPLALTFVLAGLGAGMVIDRLPRLARPAAAVAVAVALVLPGLRSTLDSWPETIAQSRLPGDLSAAVDRAGGAARLRACGTGGHVYTEALLVPQVAWRLGLHFDDLTYRPIRSSAVVVRAQVSPDEPAAPPLDAFAGLPQRTLAVATRWRILVTGRCAG